MFPIFEFYNTNNTEFFSYTINEKRKNDVSITEMSIYLCEKEMVIGPEIIKTLDDKCINGYKMSNCSLTEKEKDPFRSSIFEKMKYVKLSNVLNCSPLDDYIPINIKNLLLIDMFSINDNISFWKLLSTKQLDFLEISEIMKPGRFKINTSNIQYIKKVFQQTIKVKFNNKVLKEIIRFPELYQIVNKKNMMDISIETLVLDREDITDFEIKLFVNSLSKENSLYVSSYMFYKSVIPKLFNEIRSQNIKIKNLGIKSWSDSYDITLINFTDCLHFWDKTVVGTIKRIAEINLNIKKITTGADALTENESLDFIKAIKDLDRNIDVTINKNSCVIC